jgi:hypothetical protein
VVGWVSYVTTRDTLRTESQLRKNSEAMSRKLSENLNLSLAAFEQMFDSLGEEPLGFGPPGGPGGGFPGAGFPGGPPGLGRPPGGGRENRDGRGGRDARPMPPFAADRTIRPPVDAAKMLESMLNFYEKFAEQNATNSKLQLDAAKAYRRVGQIRHRMGDTELAEAAWGRSLTMLEQLLGQFGELREIQHDWVLTVAALPPLPVGDARFADRMRRFSQAADLADHMSLPRPAMVDLLLKWAEMVSRTGEESQARHIRRRAETLGLPPRARP